MKKTPAISIGKTFLLIAIFQAFVITMAAVAVMAFTLPLRPPRPGFSENFEHRMNPRKRFLKHSRVPFLTLVAALVILLLSNFLIGRWLLVPLQSLRQATRIFGRGDWTRRISDIRNDEIGELARSFNDMADRIEDQMKAEREIVATVSHELRTPLTRLRIALELLEDEHPDSVKKLETMTNDIVEIEQLIDNVFTSARLSNYSNQGVMLTSEMRNVSAKKISESSIKRFQARYPQRYVQSNNLCEDDVRICPVLMRRALENLLENAHKYSDEGTTIEANARLEIDHVMFTVRSTGNPIPEGQRMKVFDPFFQMRKTQGTGLGLTLVKRIAEAHGGTAWVACEARKNTIVIRLPLCDSVGLEFIRT